MVFESISIIITETDSAGMYSVLYIFQTICYTSPLQTEVDNQRNILILNIW
jgi:hypothetical protein